MSNNTLLSKVKSALRITHTLLDDEILDDINAAEEELVRAGVSRDAIIENDPLIIRAVKTYCLSVNSPDRNLAEGYAESFEYQKENLRKSSSYRGTDYERFNQACCRNIYN